MACFLFGLLTVLLTPTNASICGDPNRLKILRFLGTPLYKVDDYSGIIKIMAKKYCINCGELVPETAKYCPICGAPQQGEEAAKFRAEDPAIDLGKVAVDDVTSIKKAIEKNSKHSKATRAEKEKSWQKFYEKQRLGKSSVIAFFIAYITKTSILIPLFIVGLYFDPLFSALGLVIYFFFSYFTAFVVYYSFYYWVDDHSFHKSSGIIHKQNVSIPYQQIQNVNINRSFTDRVLGLSRISIETAGNNAENGNGGATGSLLASAEGYLPGVDLKTAKQVHDLLLTRADEAN